MKKHPGLFFCLILAAILIFLSSPSANAQISRQFVELDVRPGFTVSEVEVLREAAAILNNRMSTMEFLDDDAVAESRAYHLDDRAREFLDFLDCYPQFRAEFQRLFPNRSEDDAVILIQLMAMLFLPSQSEDGVFRLRIYPVDKPPENGSLLMGFVDSKQAYYLNLDCRPGETVVDSRGTHDFGEFKMTINQRALRDKAPADIAGTLLHEMLHVLGHNHPNPKSNPDDAYSKRWQINALSYSLRVANEFSESQEGEVLYLYSSY